MLYATGALYKEIVTLRWEDVSFTLSRITLVGMRHKSSRCIPIGHDLKRELRLYRQSQGQRFRRKGPLFCDEAGAVLNQRNLYLGFQRAREISGIECEYAPLIALGYTT
jgi:site-specific recombinase XerD